MTELWVKLAEGLQLSGEQGVDTKRVWNREV